MASGVGGGRVTREFRVRARLDTVSCRQWQLVAKSGVLDRRRRATPGCNA